MSESTTVESQLKAGKSVVVFTKGRSMRPLIYEGKSHVLVSPVKDKPKAGDLPLYRHKSLEHTYVIHRLIAVKDDYYIIRGDNCLYREKVPKGSILGIVTKIYRNGKEISVADFAYKSYVRFWRITTPVRLAFFYLKPKAGAVLRRIKRMCGLSKSQRTKK